MLTLTQVQNKSSAKLAGLNPAVHSAAAALIERCYACGIPILITQGLRTAAEQEALYAQGRTKPGAVVTNARGGYSYHNYGLAVDFALLLPDGKNVSWDMLRDGNEDRLTDWEQVVQIAKTLGFEWGGDWSGFRDYPHLQMTFGLALDRLRAGEWPSRAAMATVNDLLKKEDNIIKEEEAIVAVHVNGVKAADGVLDKGITYVPARLLAEAIGAKISYDPKSRTVDITLASEKAKFF
ncbi:peptidoglycan L-alanyl-D-glutamate endopeptidase CwlK [Paenibacillus sophorae]|uniref:M15 family metallopeptidase n=1 Tax=Paenibacillus sophorae TaxID=1333845 RepID=A0A1H8VWG4_9BACL|nr:M15 family metallopeptidase [Paenibacillus sophorae]QWU15630.1 M15 family metallopeptidase [Paenibacillus sophorae]SEP19623.1 peptidoglycan L-alanyl-D-glutamate endopeptidase CwlK [Paenibacillus sophorae]